MAGITKWLRKRLKGVKGPSSSSSSARLDVKKTAGCTTSATSITDLSSVADPPPQESARSIIKDTANEDGAVQRNEQQQDVVEEKSESVKVVERWIETWRQKKLDEVMTISSPDCEYHVPVEDGETLVVTLKDFVDQMQLCYESFPDYDSTWESVEEHDDDGGILIKNFSSHGTHTGKPFAFGPFPAMPARGVAIKDDPISLLVFLSKDGKPQCIRSICGEGGQIGPASYYTQIGGLII